MSDQLTLGEKPAHLTVIVTADSSWTVEGTIAGADWEAGDDLQLAFSDGTVWSATLAPGTAVFAASATEVNELVEAAPRHVDLVLVNGDARSRWATGDVKVIR